MSVCALTKAPWRFPLCRLIAWAALSLVAAPGHAVTFVVNTTADTAEAPPRDGPSAARGGALRPPPPPPPATAPAPPPTTRLTGAPTVLSRPTLTLTNTTVSGNTAGTEGRGIYNSGGGTLTITASTVSGNSANSAGSNGGGIFNAGAATLTNVTVSGNSANSGGGGVFNSGGTATLLNRTLGENSTPLGGRLSNPAAPPTPAHTPVATRSGGHAARAVHPRP